MPNEVSQMQAQPNASPSIASFRQGWRDDNPTKGVKRNQETPRERYLSGAELIRLLNRHTVSDHPSIPGYIAAF